jgi:nucleoid-associated protein YgaU
MAFVQSISRYFTQPSPDGSGSYVSTRRYGGNSRYYTYTSVEGDTFDRIAFRALHDSERYWEIADINSHVPFPDEIPVGTLVRIPLK